MTLVRELSRTIHRIAGNGHKTKPVARSEDGAWAIAKAADGKRFVIYSEGKNGEDTFLTPHDDYVTTKLVYARRPALKDEFVVLAVPVPEEERVEARINLLTEGSVRKPYAWARPLSNFMGVVSSPYGTEASNC